jgi:hypothetical protein
MVRRRRHCASADSSGDHRRNSISFNATCATLGRVLHHRLGEVDLRPVCGGELLKRRDVRPVWIARYRQHRDALQAQIAEHVVVAGVVDQRGITGL